MSITIGAAMARTTCLAVERGETKPTPGPFCSDCVEIVRVEAKGAPASAVELSIELRNKTEQSLWATLRVRTPDPSQDREVTKRLVAGGAETYKCQQTALIPKTDYRLVVQVYQDEALTKLLGSLEAKLRFRGSGGDSFDAVVSSTVWHQSAVFSTNSTVGSSVGDRVRVYTSTVPEGFVGKIAATDDTTITVSVAKGWTDYPVTLRRRDISVLEISAGGRTRSENVLLGAVVGAGVGAIVGFLEGESDDFLIGSAESKAWMFAVLFAPVGAVIGLVLPVEQWRPVPVDSFSVSVRPVPRRVGLSLTYSF